MSHTSEKTEFLRITAKHGWRSHMKMAIPVTGVFDARASPIESIMESYLKTVRKYQRIVISANAIQFSYVISYETK